MMTLSGPASPSDVERVRLLYRETIVTAEVLAACLGLSERSFYRRLDEWGWPRRRAEGSREGMARDRLPIRRHAEERLQAASRSTHDIRASVPTPAPPAPRADARENPPPGRVPVVPRGGTAQAMERFIAERLAALQADAAAGRDGDPERTARTVAHYARALQVMQATRAQAEKEPTPDEAEPPARSLSELRDELRGHLERIWDESRARRRVRKARPEPG